MVLAYKPKTENLPNYLSFSFSQGFALPEQKVEAGIQKSTKNTGFQPALE